MLLRIALLLVFAVVVAACGSSDDSESSGSDGADATSTDSESQGDTVQAGDRPAEGEYDPDGILRVNGAVLETEPITGFDPTRLLTPSDSQTRIHSLIYGNLLIRLADGSYEPGLALSATTVDPQTITVEIRPDVLFSDGTPFDAEAVAAGLMRNVDAQPDNPGALSAEVGAVEDVSVDGPLTVTIHLSTPIAGAFYPLLARGETLIVSPKAVADGIDLFINPVGAGPFVLESMELERNIILTKSETYWDADNVLLAGIEIVHADTPESIINGLRSGALDLADGSDVDGQVTAGLQGADGITVESVATDSTLFWGQLCKARPPFDDLRVRQALNYGLDREALNAAIFNGESEIMDSGLNSKSSAYHDPELDGYYAYDLEKAKELLDEAGYSDGFDMQLIVNASGGDGVDFSTVVQAQWAELGINVELVPSDDILGDFFLDHSKYPLYFFPLQRGGLDRVTRQLQLGSIGNICDYENDELNSIIAEIRAVDPTSEEAIDAWFRLDRFVTEEALEIFGVFGINNNAFNSDRVGGIKYIQNFTGARLVLTENAYIKTG